MDSKVTTTPLGKYNHLPYRQRAIAVIIDSEKNFLIAQLNDKGYSANDYTFIGGGIEEGETPEEAVMREVMEELGTDLFTTIKKSDVVTRFDWPNWLVEKTVGEGHGFRGQEQASFLLSFSGLKEAIHPNPEEVRHIKWVRYGELSNYLLFPNQWDDAQRVISDLLGDVK